MAEKKKLSLEEAMARLEKIVAGDADGAMQICNSKK